MEEGHTPSFKESLDNSLVELAESPSLQLLLYPVVPSPLREWVIGRGEAISRERLEEFLASLKEHLDALREQGVTEEKFNNFFDSEEWFDLFREALAQALRTRSRDRREYCARILKGAIADSEQKKYSPEEYLTIMADLSDLELRVAGSLYRLQQNHNHKELKSEERWEAWKPMREEVVREQQVDDNDLSITLERLASRGVVERSYALVPSTPLLSYWVSPAFDRFMEFIGIKEGH
jgi:exonuclease VII large subunit